MGQRIPRVPPAPLTRHRLIIDATLRLAWHRSWESPADSPPRRSTSRSTAGRSGDWIPPSAGSPTSPTRSRPQRRATSSDTFSGGRLTECYLRRMPGPTIKSRIALVAALCTTLIATSSAPAMADVAPSGRLCFEVAGSPGDVALVNLTPVLAQGPGFGQLISSNIASAPDASNVNFDLGTIDPNVAAAPIGSDNKVCYVNSNRSSVDLIADHLGTIDGTAYTNATPSGAPSRKIDTRTGLGGGRISPSGRLCFKVAGSPGDVALVNLTPVLAQGPGFGQLISSNIASAPDASNVNFDLGTSTRTSPPHRSVPTTRSATSTPTAPASISSPTTSAPSTAPHTPTPHQAAPPAARSTPAPVSAAAASRRRAVCASSGRIARRRGPREPHTRLGARTGIRTTHLVEHRLCPDASNVNFDLGTIDPNVAAAPIGSDNKVCYVNSNRSSVDLIADHLGTIDGTAYTNATPAAPPAARSTPAPAPTIARARSS